MADDSVIKIGTQVDISGIKAGMAEAASTVKASTSEMDAAYQRVAAATGEYAVVSANLRAVIKQLVDGSVPYSLAVKSLTPALMEQTNAAKALAVAKESLASVSKAEAGAQEEVAVATRNVTSSYYAAQGAAGLLEGRIPFRAMERFIASSSTASSVLMAAFPIIGAVALGSVVVEVGEKLYKAFDLGGEQARALAQAIEADTQSMRSMNDEIVVQIDKLQMANAKLEHKPITNAMKTAIDEASLAADRLYEKLGNDLRRVEETIKGMEGSTLQEAFGIKGSTKAEQEILQNHIRYLAEAKTVQDQLNESQSYGAVLRAKLADLQNKEAHPDPWALTNNYDTQIEALQHLIAMQGQERQTIVATMDLEKEQGKHNTLEAAHEGQLNAGRAAAAKRKADEEAIQAARQTLESLKATHAMTAAEESQYWAGLAFEAEFGSKQYTTYLDEANRATAKAQQESKRILDQWTTNAREQFSEQMRASERMKRNQEALASAVEEEGARITAAHQSAATAIQEQSLRANEASGAITKLAAAQEQARIHAQAYREELQRLDAEITKVGQDASLTPQQRAQKMGELQSQKIGVQGQAQATGISDQANIQQQIASPYLKAFDQINSSWLRVQNQMMYNTRNLSLEFAKMGQQILISIVDNMEQAALKTVEKELVMRLAHQATVATNVATDASGAAASTAIAQAASTVQGLTAAKLAFKNTYATVSQWPVVGPILAPVLASAAFVAVAAFEDGTGYVPRDGMAYLHEGEAVVPAPTVQELRGSGGGGDIHVHQQNNWNTRSDQEFQRALARNASHVAIAVQKHLRQAGH